jgi:hypothetical protein
MIKLDTDIDADIIEKVHKLKTRGYKGYKAVRITQKGKKIEVSAKNGNEQTITISGENSKKIYKRLIELIEEVYGHGNVQEQERGRIPAWQSA